MEEPGQTMRWPADAGRSPIEAPAELARAQTHAFARAHARARTRAPCVVLVAILVGHDLGVDAVHVDDLRQATPARTRTRARAPHTHAHVRARARTHELDHRACR